MFAVLALPNWTAGLHLFYMESDWNCDRETFSQASSKFLPISMPNVLLCLHILFPEENLMVLIVLYSVFISLVLKHQLCALRTE
uniref:Uncharacterized protein n=1 Tax=Mus musculus TaxID=10090 RepID=Q3UXL0_MOUSE|nr:unnamed protein product [Mus musculus]